MYVATPPHPHSPICLHGIVLSLAWIQLHLYMGGGHKERIAAVCLQLVIYLQVLATGDLYVPDFHNLAVI